MGSLLRFTLFFFQTIAVLSQSYFTSFEPLAASLIEWDQQNFTYYTGQTLQMNWTSEGFLSTDLARIQYVGAGGTRTLTSGSGTPILSGTYSLRLSDSANGVASNVPLTIAHSTNTTNNLQSTTRITVIQSKVMNIVPLDAGRILGGGQNTVCDDRNLTVSWRGLGQAQFGVATISLNRQGGFGGSSTLGTTLSNIPIDGNNTVVFVCPRGSSPSTISSYAFQISVQEPGGNAYTGTSASFTVAQAATPSPTPSTTPSFSRTPTSTPSESPTSSTTPSSTQTPSSTPSPTPSNTPSQTSSSTSSPSPSPTATASIDLVAIARNAASSVDTQTPAIAGAVGGIAGVLVIFALVKIYQRKQLTELRKKKLAQTVRFARESQNRYGISLDGDLSGKSSSEPRIVMYQVQNMPQPTKKAFEPYKRNH